METLFWHVKCWLPKRIVKLCTDIQSIPLWKHTAWIFCRWRAGDTCLEKISPVYLSAGRPTFTGFPAPGPQTLAWRNPELLQLLTRYLQKAAKVGRSEALQKSSQPLQLRCYSSSLTDSELSAKEDEMATRGRGAQWEIEISQRMLLMPLGLG